MELKAKVHSNREEMKAFQEKAEDNQDETEAKMKVYQEVKTIREAWLGKMDAKLEATEEKIEAVSKLYGAVSRIKAMNIPAASQDRVSDVLH